MDHSVRLSISIPTYRFNLRLFQIHYKLKFGFVIMGGQYSQLNSMAELSTRGPTREEALLKGSKDLYSRSLKSDNLYQIILILTFTYIYQSNYLLCSINYLHLPLLFNCFIFPVILWYL